MSKSEAMAKAREARLLIAKTAAAAGGDLPKLRTPKQAKRLLEWAYQRGASGGLTSAMVSAITKTVDVWLRAEMLEVDKRLIAALEKRIVALQSELKEARGGERQ